MLPSSISKSGDRFGSADESFNLVEPWTAQFVLPDTTMRTHTLAGAITRPPVFSVRAGQIGTGCLVGKRVLLTAAHCVLDRAAALLHAPLAGNLLHRAPLPLNINIPGQTGIVATCFVHDEFLRSGRGDLALCVLSQDINVTPAVVNVSRTLVTSGQSLTLFGTGETTPAGARPVRDLSAQIVGRTPSDLVTASLTRPGDDIDSGDSGGPALAKQNGGQFVIGAIVREVAATGEALIEDLGGSVGQRLLTLWRQQGRPPLSFAP